MKISSSISYPYPVWGWKDDYSININDEDIRIDEISDKDSFKYELEFTAHNEDIEKLILEEKAVYACIVTCSETYYHDFVVSKEPKFPLIIPRNEVNGLVKVQWVIISTQQIQGFYSPYLNEDYSDAVTFPLGAMLGYIISIEINTTLSDSQRSLDDIITVIKNDVDKIDYSFGNEIIRIKLPERELRIFNDYGSKKPYPSIMHSTIVYHALLLAIKNMFKDEYKDCQWAILIKQCIEIMDLDGISLDDVDEEEGFTLEQSIAIVDAMIKNPFKRFFEDIEDVENQNNR